MKFGTSINNKHLYRYKILIPSKLNKKKLVYKIIYFTTKDLELLLDYYKIPYKKVED